MGLRDVDVGDGLFFSVGVILVVVDIFVRVAFLLSWFCMILLLPPWI